MDGSWILVTGDLTTRESRCNANPNIRRWAIYRSDVKVERLTCPVTRYSTTMDTIQLCFKDKINEYTAETCNRLFTMWSIQHRQSILGYTICRSSAGCSIYSARFTLDKGNVYKGIKMGADRMSCNPFRPNVSSS